MLMKHVKYYVDLLYANCTVIRYVSITLQHEVRWADWRNVRRAEARTIRHVDEAASTIVGLCLRHRGYVLQLAEISVLLL